MVMKRAKIKVGFVVEEEIVSELDSVVKCSRDLQTSRSEPVDSILAAFFNKQEKPVDTARKLLIMRRKGLI